MADFRAKRVSVLEGLLLLTHATGLAAREQGRWSGYAGLSAGQGTGGGRLTLGSRGVKGAGAASTGLAKPGPTSAAPGFSVQPLVSDRGARSRRRSRDGLSARWRWDRWMSTCEKRTSARTLRPSPSRLRWAGPGRETPTRRRPAGCTEDGRRRRVQMAADGARSPACEGSGTRAERFCCSNARFERMRRRATGRGKIFAKDTSNKYTKNSQSSAVRTATIHFKDGPEPPAGASHAGGGGRVNTLSRTPRDQTRETAPRARRRRGPEHQAPAGRGAAGGRA